MSGVVALLLLEKFYITGVSFLGDIVVWVDRRENKDCQSGK